MNIRKAERKKAKIKLGIQGPAGSGKTYGALLLAKGLVGSFDKICIVDTESGSADLYAHLGNYSVLSLIKPFSPERYIQAIEAAENAGSECIIIDSLSQSWEFLLQFHSQLAGNSFTNWAKITPRYNALINKILTSTAHVIVTLRTKQDYVLSDKGNGKLKPEKVGLKSIARDGLDYEFTVLFELDISHMASCSKDRTGLFDIHTSFALSEKIGAAIRNWCSAGTSIEEVKHAIQNAKDYQALSKVYARYKAYYGQVENDFIKRKSELTTAKLSHANTVQNGRT